MEPPSDNKAVIKLRRAVDGMLKESRKKVSKIEPQKVIDKFVKATKALITGADLILSNDDFIRKLDQQKIQELKEKIDALEKRQQAILPKK